ncbi:MULTISPECIES: DNA translocase FtsK [unclassified Neisseria]|uniref:DNA translocase FtsK n=1 Tax=unclassified Neisseria TaxID=2623750 RepID=UPI00266628E7|nr:MULTISPECIES: DNA translocase FtsK [unclassified Neisseria]MDO1510879.1 DNA translocase FtsK [Neisseria sp. MVDL19-042950]MDO1517169.1 DNA translocase FtsK [Neisseria sp. MVDL18-041461]MDO1564562.1 DNA translocase FtsK [Neisseria sp. MVDL20-010259]
MLWTFLLILLLCAIAGMLWIRRRQEQEWLRELTYLSRHEETDNGVESDTSDGKQLKALRGVDPNLKNTRQIYKAAEEAKAVYDKTVEKFRALSPKHSRKLDATSGMVRDRNKDDGLNELPIFASASEVKHVVEITEDSQHEFADVNEIEKTQVLSLNEAIQPDSDEEEGNDIPMFGAVVPEVPISPEQKPLRATGKSIAPAPYLDFEDGEYRPAKIVDSSLPVITLEEATRALRETPTTDTEPQEAKPQPPVSKPTSDMEVVEINWQFRPALEEIEPPKPVVELKTIDLDDPALKRTRERVLSEVRQISLHTIPRTEMIQSVEQALNSPETIGVEDIRANLLRQRLARRRQVTAQAPVQVLQPKVIPEGEVFANLAKTDSPVNRQRIRRINMAMRESVIPDAARVEQSHVVKLQPPKIAGTSPISTRFTPYAAVPDPMATVVEPPPVPEVERQVIDIPEPPVFHNTAAVSSPRAVVHEEAEVSAVNAHISDTPRWTITDRLISESAPTVADKEGFQTASDETDEATAAIFEHASKQSAENLVRPSETTTVPAASVTPIPRIVTVPKGESHLPAVDLLQPPQFDPTATQTEEALLENSITIEEKLAEFKVKVKVMDAYSGPVITRYEIEPDVGVRGNAVLNLEKDLARSLGVASIRVVETIPGKTCMGLELPNPKRQMIRLSEIFNSPAFQESKSKLTLALGQDITGEPVVTDLGKAPHLLVAGTTGSGKSVGVNSMILSMLFKATPDEVRMIMIDPKMLELSIYEGIPHLLAPVVTDMKLAANALTWCVNEMEKRYRLMSHVGVRNLAGFNQKVAEAAARGETMANPFSLTPSEPEPLEKLPFIVVVVDEFADLMMTAGKKIEELIARLAQKARAAGIHLILATQRPSVDVITGLIKANIPTRIAFQVSSKVDSRTILDQMGAENLLGQGDMLFLPPGTGYPKRVHGAFVADDEVHRVVEYLKQFGEPNYIDDILTAGVGGDDLFSNANSGRGSDEEQDPMYDDAVACVIKTRKATISSVQRYLRIGYNRAARLIDQMEADGIVSAPEANGNRTVLAQSSEHLD